MLDLLLLAAAAVTPVQAAPAADAEMSLRCSPSPEAPLYARGAGAFASRPSGGPVTLVQTGLPSLMVEGWSSSGRTLDVALADLAGEANVPLRIAGTWPAVAWAPGKAPLRSVVDSLVREAGGTWRMDAGTLVVERRTPDQPYSYARPANRDMTLALIDALRGYGATDVTLKSDAITFSASPEVATKIRTKLASIDAVLAFDAVAIRVRPNDGRFAWANLSSVGKVGVSKPIEAGGGFTVEASGVDGVKDFFARNGDVRDIGAQTVAGPGGWALDVPISQCGASGSGSLLLKPGKGTAGIDLTVSRAGMADLVLPGVQPGQIAVVVDDKPKGGWLQAVILRPRIVDAR